MVSTAWIISTLVALLIFGSCNVAAFNEFGTGEALSPLTWLEYAYVGPPSMGDGPAGGLSRVIAVNNNLCFASTEGWLYCYSNAGNQLWNASSVGMDGADCAETDIGCTVQGVMEANGVASPDYFMWWAWRSFGAFRSSGAVYFNFTFNGVVSPVTAVSGTTRVILKIKQDDYIPTSLNQFCVLDHSLRQVVWCVNASGTVAVDAAHDAMYITHDSDGSVSKYRISTGAKLWNVPSFFEDADSSSYVFFSNGSLVATGNSGQMRTINSDDGSMMYQFGEEDNGSFQLAAALVDGDNFYMFGNRLKLYRASTMELLSTNDAFPDPPEWTPFVYNGQLYVTTVSTLWVLEATNVTRILWKSKDFYVPGLQVFDTDKLFAVDFTSVSLNLIRTNGSIVRRWSWPQPQAQINWPPVVISYTGRTCYGFSTKDGYLALGASKESTAISFTNAGNVGNMLVLADSVLAGCAAMNDPITNTISNATYKLDITTLAPIMWTYNQTPSTHYGSAQRNFVAVAGPNGERVLVSLTTYTDEVCICNVYCVIAYLYSDFGTILWKECNKEGFSEGVTISNKIIYYGTDIPDATPPVNVFIAKNLWTGADIWRTKLQAANNFPGTGLYITPVLYLDSIYYVAACSVVYSLSRATGAVQWGYYMISPSGKIVQPTSNLHIYQGKIYICHLVPYVIDLNGNLIAEFDGGCLGQLSFYGGGMYFVTGAAGIEGYGWIDLSTNTLNPYFIAYGWDAFNPESYNPTTTADGILILASTILYTAHIPSQTKLWNWTNPTGDFDFVLTRYNRIYGGTGGAVTIFNLYTGDIMAVLPITDIILDLQFDTRDTDGTNFFVVSESKVTKFVAVPLTIPTAPVFPAAKPLIPPGTPLGPPPAAMPPAPVPGVPTPAPGPNANTPTPQWWTPTPQWWTPSPWSPPTPNTPGTPTPGGGGPSPNSYGGSSDSATHTQNFFVTVFFLVPIVTISAIFLYRWWRLRYHTPAGQQYVPAGGDGTSVPFVATAMSGGGGGGGGASALDEPSKMVDMPAATQQPADGVAVHFSAPLVEQQPFTDVYGEMFPRKKGAFF